ncbi:ABC transporter permease [Streptomyces durbertensis]|uniref:ABC transporter permease n=1 Tax=Streptomyces durbertensis TaxID=2448886 RepID=A0ABR6EMM1_9ACTN|nr:ABC transporter permease [Streptomyces durbertensis]MBB1246603.1 ABC transporter permease [Streptomyces durbertensis]
MSPLRLAVWNVVASRRPLSTLLAPATLAAVALSTALCMAVLAGGPGAPPPETAADAVPAAHPERAGPTGRAAESGGTPSAVAVWSGVATLTGLGTVGAFAVGARVARRREREIGVLKAVGFRDGDVARMLLAEAGVVGASAAVVGAGGGWLLGTAAATVLGRRDAGALPSLPLAVGAAAVLLAALAGATGPAYRAYRLTPLDAMRHR